MKTVKSLVGEDYEMKRYSIGLIRGHLVGVRVGVYVALSFACLMLMMYTFLFFPFVIYIYIHIYTYIHTHTHTRIYIYIFLYFTHYLNSFINYIPENKRSLNYALTFYYGSILLKNKKNNSFYDRVYTLGDVMTVYYGIFMSGLNIGYLFTFFSPSFIFLYNKMKFNQFFFFY